MALTILAVGGTGSIGRLVVERALADGVRDTDNLPVAEEPAEIRADLDAASPGQSAT